MTPLQKLPKTVGDLSKIIVTKGFKKSPKVQKIAKSGHTGAYTIVVGKFALVYIKIFGARTLAKEMNNRYNNPPNSPTNV